MIWCQQQTGQQVSGNSSYLLGFNEPDSPVQCNMTPLAAAHAWRNLELAYPDRLLVSPAVMELAWLEDWYTSYVAEYGSAPRVDVLAFHCYAWGGVQRTVDYCRAKTNQAVALAEAWGGIPVWLTEWAYLGPWWQPYSHSDAVRYMELMRVWLEAQPRIERYAWFQLSYQGTEPWAFGPSRNTSLVDYETGELTALGEAYAREIRKRYVPLASKGPYGGPYGAP